MNKLIFSLLVLAANSAFALPIDDRLAQLKGIEIDRTQVDTDSTILCLFENSGSKPVLVGISKSVLSATKSLTLKNGLKVELNFATYQNLERGGLRHHALISYSVQVKDVKISQFLAFLAGYNAELEKKVERITMNEASISVKGEMFSKRVDGLCGYTAK